MGVRVGEPVIRSLGGGGGGVEKGTEHRAPGLLSSLKSSLSPNPGLILGPPGKGWGVVRLRGSLTQRQLKTFVNKKKLRRLHFGAAVGGPWEYYPQKGTWRESRDDQSTEKTAQDTKDGESSPPSPRAQAESELCAGGWEQVAVEERGTGPRGSSSLPTPNLSLGLPGPMEPGSQPVLLCFGGKVWNQQDLGMMQGSLCIMILIRNTVRAGEAVK